MKIIKHSDIVGLKISPSQYMKWVDEALRLQDSSILPSKTSITLPNCGFFNTMPCYIPKNAIMGVKAITRYIENNPSIDGTMMLYNSYNGELKAIIDANMVTTMRTGAVAATSIIKLKKEGAETNMSIVGLGATANATVACLLEATPEHKFNIKLMRYKNQASIFIETFKQCDNVSFTIVDTYKDLICDADVILSCITYTSKLLGEDSWFKDGVTVVPVHTRGFQNCDLFFDKVYGDLKEQIQHFSYYEKFKYFNEFVKVVIGEDAGRQSDKEKILVYNLGVALHDVYICNKIYERVESNGVSVMDIPFK